MYTIEVNNSLQFIQEQIFEVIGYAPVFQRQGPALNQSRKVFIFLEDRVLQYVNVGMTVGVFKASGISKPDY